MDTSDSRIVLRYFFASWSPICTQMRRIFDEVSVDVARHLLHNLPELSGTPYEPVVVDIDDEPGITETHGITHVPTIQLSVNGQDITSLVGARPKLALRSDIFDALEMHCRNSRATKE